MSDEPVNEPTPEEIARVMAHLARKRARKLTPEQRKEIAAKGAQAQQSRRGKYKRTLPHAARNTKNRGGIKLSDEHNEILKVYGKGNRTEGLRRILEDFMAGILERAQENAGQATDDVICELTE
jgi:hypothetical protein